MKITLKELKQLIREAVLEEIKREIVRESLEEVEEVKRNKPPKRVLTPAQEEERERKTKELFLKLFGPDPEPRRRPEDFLTDRDLDPESAGKIARERDR